MRNHDLPLVPLPTSEAAAQSAHEGSEPPPETAASRWFLGAEATLTVLAAACVLVKLVLDVKSGVGSLWWGERLAFAVGVLRGIDIYPGAHSGVITGDVYGPMLSVFYVPAALVPSITAKMIAGQLSSMLVMLVPLALVVARTVHAGGGTLTSTAAGMTMLTGVLAITPATSYQLSAIAADAPCLGLGMCSYLVLTGAPRPSYRRLAAVAALVGLSTLTKPNGAFVALGLFVIVLYRQGVARALVFGALYPVLTALLGLIVVYGTGSTLTGVWFNDVVIPSSQVMPHDLRRFVRGMGKLTLPMFALVAGTLAPYCLAAARGRFRLRAVPAAVIDLWFIAWVLVPISYLGRAKLGGDVNSFHAHYYAIAATVLAWISAFAAPPFRALRVLAFATLAAVAAPLGRGTVLDDWSDNTHERVFDYLREHGQGFFPWHPLATLEATGHYLHQSDGVYSRLLAARAPTREEFMAHAPRNPAFIGLPRSGPFLPEDFVFTELVTRYYPEYAPVPTPSPELAALGLQIFAPVRSDPSRQKGSEE